MGDLLIGCSFSQRFVRIHTVVLCDARIPVRSLKPPVLPPVRSEMPPVLVSPVPVSVVEDNPPAAKQVQEGVIGCTVLNLRFVQ